MTEQKNSKDYKKQADLKKQRDAELAWQNVTNHKNELRNVLKLREKLEENSKNRVKTTKEIVNIKSEFTNLRGNIKQFIKEQTTSSTNKTIRK